MTDYASFVSIQDKDLIQDAIDSAICILAEKHAGRVAEDQQTQSERQTEIDRQIDRQRDKKTANSFFYDALRRYNDDDDLPFPLIHTSKRSFMV